MIIPAILTDDPQVAQERLDLLSQLDPRPEAVHVDIIDGYFVDNLTFEVGLLRELDFHLLPFDLHLMAVEPTELLEELSENSGVRTVIAQVERMSSQSEFAAAVKTLGGEVGLSLNLYTPLEAVDDDVWSHLSVLQIMGGEAGTQGQFFHPSALTVMRQAKELRQEKGYTFRIMADIAMEPETISLAKEAGADDFVVGSYLQENVRDKWKKLVEAGQ